MRVEEHVDGGGQKRSLDVVCDDQDIVYGKVCKFGSRVLTGCGCYLYIQKERKQFMPHVARFTYIK